MPTEIWEIFASNFQFILGSFVVSLITLWINRGIQKHKLNIEEFKLLSKFEQVVTTEKPNKRLLLAKYYSKVAPTRAGRKRWDNYTESIQGDEIHPAHEIVKKLEQSEKIFSKSNDKLKSVVKEKNKIIDNYLPTYWTSALESEVLAFESGEGDVESLPIGRIRIVKLNIDKSGKDFAELKYTNKSGDSSKFSLTSPARQLIGNDEELVFVGIKTKEDGSKVGQFSVAFPYSTPPT